ncbi:hypothetical protein L3X38_009909 [Prunus dulcis]|uniref:Retroviral polymerase SH3-like domain-containing protein n=1 Tax=Prunus dulcis TaxID=3755 RepID=A0AAD4WG51_PRUDU|nr:hypothetical protein L3X38_009909 [Prunus dulcis]
MSKISTGFVLNPEEFGDIQTREIFGRGTKNRGLYYVDDVATSQILAVACALLLLWMDAVTYAVYLLNRLPSRVLDFQTPMQVLTHHISASSMLTLSPKVFGCVIYVHLHQNKRSKQDPCALRCVFLGFSTHQKGYRCYHRATRRLYVSIDVTFIKNEMFFSDTPNHVLQGETSSEGHKWLDLQGKVILDSLIHWSNLPNLLHQSNLLH